MTILSGELTTAVPNLLRQEALKEIEEQGLDAASLAEKLNLFPDGARRILSQEVWSPERCLRVLGALGLDVQISVVAPGVDAEAAEDSRPDEIL